jgi:ATP-dependent RNA helicase SUPV3L1/SUV3
VVAESAALTEAVEGARLLRQSADLRAPHTWYPRARALRRRIIFHAGPTNSGKTYRALQALKRAHSGAYCGPLRLLALEVFESLNGDGVYASLETGQERREMPFARHVACTVEMLSTEKRLDVVVIDEIQMIGDRQRGAAWTRALLGAVAPEVHVCGDPAALPAVAALAALCGDALEVVRYERMTELTAAERSLDSDYARVEAGDCVVAFSRKDVYAIRRTIERKTSHRCCVIYGSLPPETRSQQSRLFNDADSGFRVLVATDAVGMGLNLNIRRVVFHAMDKFDGEAVGPVPPAHVKQIAGRAGRRSSRFPRGWATALHPADLPYLHACLAAPPAPIAAAGLFPNAEQLIRFAELLPADTPFSALIAKFVSASHLDGPYFMCRDSTIKQVAALLQPYPLSLPERCALALVPINLRNINVRAYFARFLAQFCAGAEVRLDVQLPLASPSYLGRDLEALETKVQTLDVYLWLGQRLGPFGFPDLSAAADMRRAAAELLELALTQLSDDTKGDWEFSLRARRSSRDRERAQHAPPAAAAAAPGAAAP